MKKVESVFEVTDFKTGQVYEEILEGAGQEPIKFLRKEYSRYSKFVLKGFLIDGDYKSLN